jgi:hypothetical protein
MIVTSHPFQGTYYHVSFLDFLGDLAFLGRRRRNVRLGIPFLEGFGGPETHETKDAGGGFSRADRPVVIVPTGHNALEFLATEVWGDACERLVLVASAKETMPIIRAVEGAMVGGCLETLITEFGRG